MRVLVACEESQAVTKELRVLGHEAYSCDIQECSGGHPEWHILGDVLRLLNGNVEFNTMDGNTHVITGKWDMIIAHPPCTYLTVTGNRWFNVDRYGEKAIERKKERKKAIDFFLKFANANCEKIAIENPVGIMSTEWRKPDCIIQPYMFGEPFEKKTCFWLKGLEPLKATNVVEPPKRKQFASGKTMPSWYAEASSLPKEERSKIRSKTFTGIAKAIAKQWGGFIDYMEVENMKLTKSELIEGNKLIDFEELKNKEPELYEELLADYPVKSNYVMVSHFEE